MERLRSSGRTRRRASRELLFVSGRAGMDPATGALGDAFLEQATQALRNLQAVVEAGRSRLDLVVNTTVLLADFGDFAELNQVFAEFFATDPPARMTMQTPLPGTVGIRWAAWRWWPRTDRASG